MIQKWIDKPLNESFSLVGTYDDDSGRVLLCIAGDMQEYTIKEKFVQLGEDVTLDQIRIYFQRLTCRILNRQGKTLDLWINALKKKT